MIVPKNNYSAWRRKYKHGDATKIHLQSKIKNKKVSRQAISGALNGNGCDLKTKEVINEYYNIK